MGLKRAMLSLGGLIAMGILARLLGGSGWTMESEPPPWGGRPSIYRHLLANTRGEELSKEGRELPDEAKLHAKNEVGWVGGAIDGVMGHHGRVKDDQGVERAWEALAAALDKPSQKRLATLYAVLEDGALGIVDPLLERVVSSKSLQPSRLHTLARWLATSAPDREPVKIGVALLGVLGGFDDSDVLVTLGQHDEFTLFASVALVNTLGPAAEPRLWALAKNVHGWGRIQLVERLAATKDAAIKRWLLTDGYRNEIMLEYTALTCANAGELVAALRAPEVDRAVLTGAGDILSALVAGQGGPAEGMNGFGDGAEAALLYLKQMAKRDDLTLADFNSVGRLEAPRRACRAGRGKGTARLV